MFISDNLFQLNTPSSVELLPLLDQQVFAVFFFSLHTFLLFAVILVFLSSLFSSYKLSSTTSLIWLIRFFLPCSRISLLFPSATVVPKSKERKKERRKKMKIINVCVYIFFFCFLQFLLFIRRRKKIVNVLDTNKVWRTMKRLWCA